MQAKCIEPGRWIISGRRVSAVYQGRSRNVLGWNVDPLPGDGDLPAGTFGTLRDVRAWIARQPHSRLTPAQARILAAARRHGYRTYTGVASRPIKALEDAGLVAVAWDAGLDHTKGRLRWHIGVWPVSLCKTSADGAYEVASMTLAATSRADPGHDLAQPVPTHDGWWLCVTEASHGYLRGYVDNPAALAEWLDASDPLCTEAAWQEGTRQAAT